LGVLGDQGIEFVLGQLAEVVQQRFFTGLGWRGRRGRRPFEADGELVHHQARQLGDAGPLEQGRDRQPNLQQPLDLVAQLEPQQRVETDAVQRCVGFEGSGRQSERGADVLDQLAGQMVEATLLRQSQQLVERVRWLLGCVAGVVVVLVGRRWVSRGWGPVALLYRAQSVVVTR